MSRACSPTLAGRDDRRRRHRRGDACARPRSHADDPRFRWTEADLAAWHPPLPGRPRLQQRRAALARRPRDAVPALFEKLAPTACWPCRCPTTLRAPSHVALLDDGARSALARSRWRRWCARSRCRAARRTITTGCRRMRTKLDMWRTTYLQVLRLAAGRRAPGRGVDARRRADAVSRGARRTTPMHSSANSRRASCAPIRVATTASCCSRFRACSSSRSAAASDRTVVASACCLRAQQLRPVEQLGVNTASAGTRDRAHDGLRRTGLTARPF